MGRNPRFPENPALRGAFTLANPAFLKLVRIRPKLFPSGRGQVRTRRAGLCPTDVKGWREHQHSRLRNEEEHAWKTTKRGKANTAGEGGTGAPDTAGEAAAAGEANTEGRLLAAVSGQSQTGMAVDRNVPWLWQQDQRRLGPETGRTPVPLRTVQARGLPGPRLSGTAWS